MADTLLAQVKEDYKFVEENEDDDEEDQYRFEKILYIMRYPCLSLRCKKQVPKSGQPVKKIKTDKSQTAGEYLYYDDLEKQLVDVVPNSDPESSRCDPYRHKHRASQRERRLPGLQFAGSHMDKDEGLFQAGFSD